MLCVPYRFTANASTDDVGIALALLSPDERARADRFRFAHDRRDFVLAHALLRTTLSEGGDRAADEWTFGTDPNGKPFLAGGGPVAFSLSHTAGLVACAVSTDGEVGVDVERVARVGDWRAIATRYFSKAELRAIEAEPQERRPSRFIEIWTLKEAFAKALGLGLSQPLDSSTFLVAADGSVSFEPPAGLDRDAWRFSLRAPAPGYRLAVALALRAHAVDPAGVAAGLREVHVEIRDALAIEQPREH